MRSLFLALAALSLLFVSTTGCSDKETAPTPAPVAKPAAPVYPSPCPKLRNCLNAFKAQMPNAAAEFDDQWNTVKAEYRKSPQNAANHCAMSLRGYAKRANVPMSCR